MTPEREGRGSRKEKTGPALRFEKGADMETAGPKDKGRPTGVWKKTAARTMTEPASADAPGRPADLPAPEQAGEACDPTGLGPPPADDPPERPADPAGPGTSGQSVPKYRQYSHGAASGSGAPSGKFRQDGKLNAARDRLARS